MEHSPLQTPEISVIIPVYNTEPYLEACLESVRNQTFPDFEVLAINDGSTDNSMEILQRFSRIDPRFHCMETGNQGVAAARETALSLARGNFVCFLDSDDTWQPGMLAELHKGISGSGQASYDIAVCDYVRIRPGYAVTCKEKSASPLHGQEFLFAVLGHKIFPSLCAKLYRKNLFEHTQAFPFKIGEDTLINIQIGLKQPKVVFCDYPGYNYMQRPGSGVRTPIGIEYAENYCRTVDRLLSPLQEETSPEILDFARSIYYSWWYFAYMSKSHNPWQGNCGFARETRRLFLEHKKQLKIYFSSAQRIMLRLDGKRAFRPVVLAIATGRRLATSLQRRLRAGDRKSNAALLSSSEKGAIPQEQPAPPRLP